MNLLSIIGKEIKQEFRNRRRLLMAIGLPIALLIVLGSALSGAFNQQVEFPQVKVAYTNTAQGPLSSAFTGFIKQGSRMNLTFQATSNAALGKQRVENGKAACYIQVNSADIELVKSDSETVYADMVEALLQVFVQKYNTLRAVGTVKPEMVTVLANESANNNYVRDVALNDQAPLSSMEYYAIAMLALMIMRVAMNGAHSIAKEWTLHTANRLFCSPVKRYEVLAGKIIGNTLVAFLQVIAFIVVANCMLGIDWGPHIGFVLLIEASAVLMAISLGMGIFLMVKSEAATRQILNVVVLVFCFLGGVYFSIDGLGQGMANLADLSPIKWVNKAVTQVIYTHDFGLMGTAVLVNLAIAVVFIGISSYKLRKESIA